MRQGLVSHIVQGHAGRMNPGLSAMLPRVRRLAPWLLALGLLEVLAWLVHEREHSHAQQELAQRSGEARAVLEGEINASIYLSSGLATYIQSQNGHIDDAGLLPWMRALVEQGRHIRNIGLAPDNRIRFIYPLAGNEAVIDLYYPDLPEQWPAVQKMIANRQPLLVGPLRLLQGGNGLIYRIPVFIDDHYWGLVSTVLDADPLLAVLQRYADQRAIRLSLARYSDNPANTTATVFWGTPIPAAGDNHHDVDIALPGTTWRLTVFQRDDHVTTWTLRMIGWALLALVAVVLGRAQRSRQRVDRLKSEFVSIVSHELRTPLAAIIGALRLLDSEALGPLPEPAKPLLGIANNNAARLNQLVNDLLDMERLSTSRLPMVLSWQPLRPLLEQALTSNAAYAERFGVELVFADDAMARADQAQVNVDALRLQQILTNLLGNAAKFSPRGGTVQLDVALHSDQVRIAVRDHGPGIPEAFRADIFDKFSQADASDTREKGGSGLGLAIARALTIQMSGHLDFTCPTDGGTCFTLDLPRFAPPGFGTGTPW